MELRVLRSNPGSNLRLPAPRATKREKFCTFQERDLLISTAHTQELRLILVLGFHAGMRIREIIESRREWLHLDHSQPYIEISNHGHETFETKSGKSRAVPLNSFAAEFLSPYATGTGYIIRPEKKQGKAIYRYDPKGVFARHMAKQGLPWVTPHTMRHTFGALALSASLPSIRVRRYMGITEKVFEDHYAGLLLDGSIEAILKPPN